MEHASSFIKKTLKKQQVDGNKLCIYCLLLFSDIIIETNKFFIFRCLLNFMKCIRGQIKAFSFLFCNACDVKSTKSGVLIMSKKRKDSSSVFTLSGKLQKSTKWTAKKKTYSFCEFRKSV